MSEEDTPKPGPKPEHLKIDGDWKSAVKKALSKPRPAGGWPKGEEPEPDSEEGEAEERSKRD